jgi:hypothetical protein
MYEYCINYVPNYAIVEYRQARWGFSDWGKHTPRLRTRTDILDPHVIPGYKRKHTIGDRTASVDGSARESTHV